MGYLSHLDFNFFSYFYRHSASFMLHRGTFMLTLLNIPGYFTTSVKQVRESILEALHSCDWMIVLKLIFKGEHYSG